jgi:hypothetical protein
LWKVVFVDLQLQIFAACFFFAASFWRWRIPFLTFCIELVIFYRFLFLGFVIELGPTHGVISASNSSARCRTAIVISGKAVTFPYPAQVQDAENKPVTGSKNCYKRKSQKFSALRFLSVVHYQGPFALTEGQNRSFLGGDLSSSKSAQVLCVPHACGEAHWL